MLGVSNVKKICILTDRFLYGGLERNIFSFINIALQKNYKIVLITHKSNPEAKRKLREKNVKVYEVNMSENANYTELVKNIHSIVSILKKENCSTVILHPFLSLIYGYIASIIADLPYFVMLHGPLSITFSIPPEYVYKLLLKNILENAIKVYCVSEDLIYLLKDMFPDLQNLSLFPNALLSQKFKYLNWDPNGSIVLVSTFHKVKLKGIVEFLHLFKNLPYQYKRTVHVFGDGEAIEDVKKWIKANNLEKYFKFYGFLEKYIDKIPENVCFGVGIARSAVELMAANIPVLILGLDGPKGFINKSNFKDFLFSNFSGFHFPNIGIDEFLTQWSDILNNPSEYKLADLVKDELNLENYFKEFEKDLENIFEKFSGYNREKKFHAYKLLLAYFSAKDFRDLNFVYNLFFFSQANEPNLYFYGLLLKTNNNIENLLTSKSEDLQQEIWRLKNELLKEKQRNRELELQIKSKENELHRIYSSRFWKLASKYYKIKGIIIKLLKKIKEKYVITRIKRIADSYRMEKKKIFIYPPTIDWNIPLFQRPQHLSLQLSNKGNLVFYFTPNHVDKVFGLKEIKEGLFLSSLFEEFLNSFESYEGCWMFLPSTNNEISIWQIRKLKSKGMKIIYDYIDEIHPDISPETHISLKTYMELKNEDVDLITCVSKKLYKEMLKRFPKEKVIYLPNGVDYFHFKVSRDIEKINDYMRSIVLQGKPIIGYYGALANWIDYELLICTASKHQDWNFILIGIDYEGSLQQYLDKFPPNIYFLGHIPYEKLPWYAIWFDVALIPFKKGEIAKATSPIKMYEYMALNKPIVATEDLIECYGYKGVFISKNDCEDFSQKILQALELKDNPEILKELDKIAQENTWEKRVETLLEYINKNDK